MVGLTVALGGDDSAVVRNSSGKALVVLSFWDKLQAPGLSANATRPVSSLVDADFVVLELPQSDSVEPSGSIANGTSSVLELESPV
jgi:hypothetical protein